MPLGIVPAEAHNNKTEYPMSRLLALLALAPLLAGAAETTAPKPPSAFTVEAQRRTAA